MPTKQQQRRAKNASRMAGVKATQKKINKQARDMNVRGNQNVEAGFVGAAVRGPDAHSTARIAKGRNQIAASKAMKGASAALTGKKPSGKPKKRGPYR